MPYVRPIDAENLREWLLKQKRLAKSLVIIAIDETPTLDYAPVKHGRWIQIEGFTACSECGASPADWEAKPDNPLGLPPFCHSCGLKMDTKGEEE